MEILKWVKSTTVIEQLTQRPLALYFSYPSQVSSKKVTLESFGPISSERINNWKKIFSSIENIDLNWTINFLIQVHADAILNSTNDSTPLDTNFPILIFQPGATGNTQDYAFLLEQFASYGIIILSIDRPIAEGIDKFYFLPTDKKYVRYDAKSDQEKYQGFLHGGHYPALINTQIIEHLFEITSSQHLNYDQNKIFISGHSMGGDGAFRSSSKTNNVKGYINFDGGIDSSMEDDFDHGSVGNNPIYVENSPLGKGFSLSSDYRGRQKASEAIYKETSLWLIEILNHY